MNTTHTPGPWKWRNTIDGRIVLDQARPEFDTMPPIINATNVKERDARLIAAAPELLEACQAAYTALINRLGPHHQVTEQVGRAIAAAEGIEAAP